MNKEEKMYLFELLQTSLSDVESLMEKLEKPGRITFTTQEKTLLCQLIKEDDYVYRKYKIDRRSLINRYVR